jgi:hypothetical protein
MITLTRIGIGLKGLLALGVLSTLLLAACSKEKTGQCSVCTVETSYNGAVLSTQTVEQTQRESKASGNCTSTQEEFKQGLYDEIAAQGLDANVTCEYE